MGTLGTGRPVGAIGYARAHVNGARRSPGRRVALLLLGATLALCAAPARAREPARGGRIVLGLSPEVNIFRQKARYRPLAAYLERAIGRPVEVTILVSYADALAALERGALDGAFLGSLPAALAVERLGAIPLARVGERDGRASYRGAIFVRKDSGLRGAPALRGKRMAFVDRATSAGYLFPIAWLRGQGVRPDGFFSEEFFAGSHDAAIRAVLDRTADAGAAKDRVLDGMRAADPRVDAELLVLATSDELPSTALCVRRDLDPAVRQALARALLAAETAPDAAEALASLQAIRFVETSPESYRPVAALARAAGVDLARHRPR